MGSSFNMRQELIKKLVLFLIVFVFPASAARLSYQGVLEQEAVPVSESVEMEFALCAEKSCEGNSSLCSGDPANPGRGISWCETQTVGVEGGIFSVELGSVNDIPASVVGQGDLYLRVRAAGEVLSEEPEEPGQKIYQHLVSVPYAMGSQGDFIVSNGNVGIGTTTPLSIVQISRDGFTASFGDTTIVDQGIAITSKSGSTNPVGITFGNDVNSYGGIYGKFVDGASNTTGDLFIATRQAGSDSTFTEAITIKASGNVGIGTAFPSASLDIGGKVRAYTDGTDDLLVKDNLEVGNHIYVDGTGNNYFAGNVGIGTAAPEEKLHVAGGNILLDNNKSLEMKHSTGVVVGHLYVHEDNSGLYLQNNASDGAIRMYAGGGGGQHERLTLLSTGNVGIGTMNPGDTLELKTGATLKIGNRIRIKDDQSDSSAWFGVGSELNKIKFGDADFIDPKMTINLTTGYVGIGTPFPNYPLDVVGDIHATGSIIVNGPGDGYFDGNVGIGTAAPEEKLHVSSGNILLDNNHSLRMKHSTGEVVGYLYVHENNSGLYLQNNDRDGAIRMYAGGGGGEHERLTLLSTGNVGIGNINPQAKLDVNGSLLTRGSVRVEGDMTITGNTEVGNIDAANLNVSGQIQGNFKHTNCGWVDGERCDAPGESHVYCPDGKFIAAIGTCTNASEVARAYCCGGF